MTRLLWGFRIAVVFGLLLAGIGLAQDNSPAPLPDGTSEISMSTSVSTQKVPRNRTVVFTVQIEWSGKLAVYDFTDIQNPAVENFEIVSTATTHRTEVRDGQQMAVKKLEYTLKPKLLGMGYVGDMAVTYRNLVTGEQNRLMTSRLGVKVIDAVAEPGSEILGIPKVWFFRILFGIILAGIIAFVLRRVIAARRAARRQSMKTEITEPLEKQYLARLKDEVDLNSAEIGSQFATVSHLLRGYLAEKYAVSASATTHRALAELSQLDVAPVSAAADEILNTCDMAKFSGGTHGNSELARVFTLLETLLENALKSASMPEMEK